MLIKNKRLNTEAKAWVKRKAGPDEIIRVVPEDGDEHGALSYNLYTAFNEDPDYLGRILFDDQGYWIYDGDVLSVLEQEQVAAFIINYAGGI
jgi:hypothetical protein